MPSNYTNASSHRRTLSSKSLSTNTSKAILSSRPPSHSKLSALGKKRNTEVEFSGEQLFAQEIVVDDMTFLQYCPICDKQILVPNSQVLYCSESCRRKDSLSTTPPPQLNLALRFSNTSISPISPSLKMAFEENRFGRSPPGSPTRVLPSMASASLPATIAKPPELHGYKPDLDPTEWKPNLAGAQDKNNPVSAFPTPIFVPNLLPEGSLDTDEGENSETTVPIETATKPDLSRRQSAAFGYLAQFHRSANSFLSLVSKRPGVKSRSSTSSVSIPGALADAPDLQTPEMSLDRSSGCSSSASSGISIAIHRSDDHSAKDHIEDDGIGNEDTLLDEGLAFGKKSPTVIRTLDMGGSSKARLSKVKN